MRNTNFKKGDKIRIRSWDDMKKEFGIIGGNIHCLYTFSKPMKHLCGRTATISDRSDIGVALSDWSDYSGRMSWAFSIDMIEFAVQYTITPTELCQVGSQIDNILIVPQMLSTINSSNYYINVNNELIQIGIYYIPRSCVEIAEL